MMDRNLFSIHDPINSDNIANTTARKAALNQDSHHVSLKVTSTHSSISLQLFFSHIVDNWINKIYIFLIFHNILFLWSSFQSLWALAYLSLFTLSPFWKSVFFAATLPQRPFLIKLLQTVEGSTWHPNEAARCGARSLLDFLWLLKEETLRNFSSDTQVSTRISDCLRDIQSWMSIWSSTQVRQS